MSPETRSVMHSEREEAVMQTVQGLPVHAHWLPRVAVAAVFIFHGFQKFPYIDAYAAATWDIVPLAYLVAYMEVAAGLLLLLGGMRGQYADIATRLGGLLIIPVMIGAIAKAHWPRFSFVPTEAFPIGGMEFQLTLIAVGLFFFLRGSPRP